jgi:small subunit ribosomal protein S9
MPEQPESSVDISEGSNPVASPEPVQEPVVRPKEGARLIATGRRKESVARVYLVPGSGNITVNRKGYEQYFSREALRLTVRQPLVVTNELAHVDVKANVDGGGIAGQAGALRMGIARALAVMNPAHHAALRGAGFLTRDPRMRERKKYGRKGARKQFQWTKR